MFCAGCVSILHHCSLWRWSSYRIVRGCRAGRLGVRVRRNEVGATIYDRVTLRNVCQPSPSRSLKRRGALGRRGEGDLAKVAAEWRCVRASSTLHTRADAPAHHMTEVRHVASNMPSDMSVDAQPGRRRPGGSSTAYHLAQSRPRRHPPEKKLHPRATRSAVAMAHLAAVHELIAMGGHPPAG